MDGKKVGMMLFVRPGLSPNSFVLENSGGSTLGIPFLVGNNDLHIIGVSGQCNQEQSGGKIFRPGCLIQHNTAPKWYGLSSSIWLEIIDRVSLN